MKKNQNYLVKMIVPLILLVVLTIVANRTGLFQGLDRMIVINTEKIFQIVVAISLIMVLGNFILMVLSFFKTKTGRIGTMTTLLSSVVKYAMILIAFCWILSIIGVNVSTIFASIGIVALILGFGAESLVADLVTGVFILFENEYNIGDIIEVDGFRGTVNEIGIRTLSVEDAGGNIKIINNSDLKNIINRSNRGSIAVCDIGIGYETDLEMLDDVLVKIMDDIKNKHQDVFTGKIQYLGVEALNDSSITLRFVAETTEDNIFSARRLLNKELKIAFDKQGISIPFPQLDVHTN